MDLALNSGNRLMVGLLLDHGADPADPTTLEMAARQGQLGITRLLLSRIPQGPHPGLDRALVIAGKHGYKEIEKELEEHRRKFQGLRWCRVM